MLIPKKVRKAILTNLFQEGVIVAKKDFAQAKHIEVQDASNLYVIKLMQSLKSRNYVTETFNWQFYYFYLTNEGIDFLRGYLHLPEDIVPATLKKPRVTAAPQGREPSVRGASRREGPRRGPETGGEKKVGAPSSDFKPEFRGGYGRGGFQRGQGGSGREGYRKDAPGSGRGAPHQ